MKELQPNNITFVTGTLLSHLATEARILAAYLHGSILTNRFRKESDIDCALLLFPGMEIPPQERLSLMGHLIGVLGHPVDIGLLNTRNLVYFMQVMDNGLLLFCRDEARKDLMVASAYSLYAKLREERREIEHAYTL